jgi:hypothetical protein
MDDICMLISQNIDLCHWWEICKWILLVMVAIDMGKYNIGDGELGTKGTKALNDVMIWTKVGECTVFTFELTPPFT